MKQLNWLYGYWRNLIGKLICQHKEQLKWSNFFTDFRRCCCFNICQWTEAKPFLAANWIREMCSPRVCAFEITLLFQLRIEIWNIFDCLTCELMSWEFIFYSLIDFSKSYSFPTHIWICFRFRIRCCKQHKDLTDEMKIWLNSKLAQVSISGNW